MEQADDSCQIYLVVPADIDRTRLDEVISGDAIKLVSCVLLQGTDGTFDDALARSLLTACHGADIPLLIENDADAASQFCADGVHVSGAEDDVANARARLGDDAIVGAACEATRHLAMSLSERGADYVAFRHGGGDEVIDLVEWWSDVTVVPCVGWNIEDLEIARRLADAGADFISFNTLVWSHPAGPVAALNEIADALSHGRATA